MFLYISPPVTSRYNPYPNKRHVAQMDVDFSRDFHSVSVYEYLKKINSKFAFSDITEKSLDRSCRIPNPSLPVRKEDGQPYFFDKEKTRLYTRSLTDKFCEIIRDMNSPTMVSQETAHIRQQPDYIKMKNSRLFTEFREEFLHFKEHGIKLGLDQYSYDKIEDFRFENDETFYVEIYDGRFDQDGGRRHYERCRLLKTSYRRLLPSELEMLAAALNEVFPDNFGAKWNYFAYKRHQSQYSIRCHLAPTFIGPYKKKEEECASGPADIY